MLFFVFLFGLCVGSFLNVVICRFPSGEKISGRSHCPHCNKQIIWYDLIPVFSFFRLFGKCRNCKEKISWQYPLVEVFTGVLFVLVFSNFQPLVLNFQNVLQIFYPLAILCLLIPVFVIDLKHYIIPDKFVIFLCALSFVFNIIFDFLNWRIGVLDCWIASFSVSGIIAALLASGFFLLIILISRGKWMGLGDAKFAIFMGLFLGLPKIVCALFLAFAMGAIIGVVLIFLKKKKLGSEIPFGPFLVLGTLISMFVGNQIIGWYIRLIF